MDKQIGNSIRHQTEANTCSVCRDLLIHLNRFFEMLDNARSASKDEWLTVEEVANELKLSKSIVYRIVRNGELEAVNLVETDGHVAQKGHYRIKRQCLEHYLESKKVKPLGIKSQPQRQPRHLPKVKNHLGL